MTDRQGMNRVTDVEFAANRLHRAALSYDSAWIATPPNMRDESDGPLPFARRQYEAALADMKELLKDA